MSHYGPLTPDEIQQVHEASLHILESVGLLVRNSRARDIFARHGCRVDHETNRITIPRKVIESYRQGFQPSFLFRGRDPGFDRTVPADRPVFVTASSAPNIIDPATGAERRATSSDIANVAFLINELPGYDVFSISTLAADASPGQFSLSRVYPAVKNCLKPVRTNTMGMADLLQVLELAAIIAGGEAAYRERPLICHHFCPVISPLTMDVDSMEAFVYLTEKGLPVYGSIVPNAGMSAPFSLAATLALGNAEFLTLASLQQMIRPGSQLIYSVLSTVADMRTASYAPGGIETAILQMAHSQMAGYYGVPSGGYIGLTNAHANDAQCGYETGMGTTAALLAGTDVFNTGGLLSSLMALDYAKAVIDNEIALMLKRMRRGVEVNAENLCLDVVAEVGPGGAFLDHADTAERVRRTALYPGVATRETRVSWKQRGRQEAHDRALTVVERILSRDNPAVFSEETDRKIRARFAGLVAGNVVWQK